MTEASLSGWLAEGCHYLPVRVYYEDTDAGGIVYHSNYLKFAERARTEMLRLLGFNQTEMMQGQDGIVFAVRACSMDFMRPARFDDFLLVQSRLTHMGGASLGIAQRVLRGDDKEELVAIDIKIVCVGKQGLRAVRIPDYVRARLLDYLPTERD